MSFAREVKRRVKMMIPPAVFLALTGYFGWSATQGDRGLEAMAQRRDQLRLAHLDKDRATAEQQAWDRKVGALRIGRLDTDALDERSREMLNLADPADVIVMYPKKLY